MRLLSLITQLPSQDQVDRYIHDHHRDLPRLLCNQERQCALSQALAGDTLSRQKQLEEAISQSCKSSAD